MEHKNILKGFQTLFPSEPEMNAQDEEEFFDLVDFYSEDLKENSKDVLISELKIWRRKINELNQKPKSAIDALIVCDYIYPNIYRLLQILATLPVSTSSAERSFSSLKRIKTYLRNSISEVIFLLTSINNDT